MSSKTVLVDGGLPVAVDDDDGEGTRFSYNLLPVGKFYDKRYGVVDITPEMLKEMENNFGKYPSYEVPVKLGHGDGAQSPGKVVGVKAKPDGLEITMDVDAETAEAIEKKRYRYMSAEFGKADELYVAAEYSEKYMDKKTGAPVGAVLVGAALVNQPANPYMAPLVLVDDIEPELRASLERSNDDMEKETLELMKKQLSDAEAREKQAREELEEAKKAKDEKEAEAKSKEDEAKKANEKIAELEAANKALADEKAAIEAANKSLADEKAAAEAAKAEAEVKEFCDSWMSKGIPPAVMEKVKPILLSEGKHNVIKLSDTDEASLIKVFGDVFESMPRVAMEQVGSTDSVVELSDSDKARDLGKRIAATLNKG